MTTRLLLATALLSSLLACEIGGGEVTTGASSSCVPVGTACAADADCCSYGCLAGICAANPVEGGACRDSDDCAGGRLCKSGGCTTPTPGMCRDTGDVCSLWSQCCSGNCEGGDCTVNRPPAASAGPDVPDAPYTRPFTLANASADPDGDPLVYGWTLLSTPAGSAAALSSATAAMPTFTPDRQGTYVVRLVVTEGPIGAPDRYTVEDQVTIVAVNRTPEATVYGPQIPMSRNVVLHVNGTAGDPDGDAIDCAWRVTLPGAAAPVELVPFAPCANPGTVTLDYTPTQEGSHTVELVVRDHDRTSAAVVNTALAGVTFTVKNDPPTPATTLAEYFGNVGETLETTPPVTLDASPSTDVNGDHLGSPGLAFSWQMASAPGGAILPLTGQATATPSFTPDREGQYVLELTVADPAGATATRLVPVRVGRYIRPFDGGHDVVDAAYAKVAAGDKLVTAGHDPSDTGTPRTKGMIWVYDVATGTEAPGIALVNPADPTASGVPKLVGVTPDGAKAVVVDATGAGIPSVWIVTLATGTMVRLDRPFDVGALVVASARYAYLFSTVENDAVRQIDLQSNTITAPFGTSYGSGGLRGAASAGAAAPYLYRIENSLHYLQRYAVGNNGLGTGIQVSGPTCPGYTSPTAMWATLDNQFLVTSCGTVHATGVPTGTLGTLLQTLPFSPTHLDSVASGSIRVLALDETRTTLRRLNSLLQPVTTDALPRWAQDGAGRVASARKAFLDSTGTKRIAVVHDGFARHGIVTFSD